MMIWMGISTILLNQKEVTTSEWSLPLFNLCYIFGKFIQRREVVDIFQIQSQLDKLVVFSI